MASPEFTEDRIWLNGREESIKNPRLKNCLLQIRRVARDQTPNVIPESWHVHICSENNFPTAAGLASSAAGYACLVATLAQLYGVSGDMSAIARQGSGSACRSMLGGFVRWHKGVEESGSDSVATQIAPASHWPELRILVLVVSDHKKKTSSTIGMQNSVATSELLNYRAHQVVPGRVKKMEKAIMEKDFTQFAEITMRDSNQFHAVALDTYPPAIYMNDTSHSIVNLIHKFNAAHGQIKVAYTFDAGPNACLYMLESEVPEVVGLIDWAFPAKDMKINVLRGLQTERNVPEESLTGKLEMQPLSAGMLQYLILTKVGDGPQKLEGDFVHLLDKSGQPMMQPLKSMLLTAALLMLLLHCQEMTANETPEPAGSSLAKYVLAFSRPGAFKEIRAVFGEEPPITTSCPPGDQGLECRQDEARRVYDDCPGGGGGGGGGAGGVGACLATGGIVGVAGLGAGADITAGEGVGGA
ncbi:Diphosphomevalonate decarboxylase, partial [Gryllus bimaculatus]